ncbi:MAG: radical SAM protein, partial [Candidatus Omnitrophota bacterium]|nr:radical SAM protein [Candidatus Omnitrophota bacterium]
GIDKGIEKGLYKGREKGLYKGREKGLYRGKNFIRLLQELNDIRGIERIRFMTSHPKDASPELFRAMRDLEKVCEHLHLPLQSGSDRVLKLMNRGYSRDRYLKLAQDYKKILPGGAITTDIIVGFPSESENDFKATLGIMKKIRFDSAFIFKYSPRPPAKSAELEDTVPEEAKGERLASLLDLQCSMSFEKNKAMKGMVAEILVDGYNKKTPSMLTGRTRTNRIAVFEGGKNLIGDFVNIKIDAASPHALKGRIVK